MQSSGPTLLRTLQCVKVYCTDRLGNIIKQSGTFNFDKYSIEYSVISSSLQDMRLYVLVTHIQYSLWRARIQERFLNVFSIHVGDFILLFHYLYPEIIYMR
jgi:hypothetical protein